VSVHEAQIRLRFAAVPLSAADCSLLLITTLGLALRLYLLTRPGFLSSVLQYDDGVDFGAAISLIHGYLPYRDYAFVQPPGIVWVLAPVALLTKVTTMHFGFAVARLLTACAGAASVLIGGLLVRHRGVVCTTLTCGILALYPDSIGAASSVFLEPWLVLFCLLGALALFPRGELAGTRRRLVLSGLAFGFAGAIKAWALLPVIVIVGLLFATIGLRRLWAYVVGLVVGFGMPVLPFFVLAPGTFLTSVTAAQLSRADSYTLPVMDRIGSLLGFGAFTSQPGGLIGISDTSWHNHLSVVLVGAGLVAMVLLCVFYASVLTRHAPSALELFGLATTVLLVTAFMWTADFYFHYGAFLAPFLALSVSLPLARLSEALARQRTRFAAIFRAGQLAAVLGVVGAVVLAGHLFARERALAAPTAPASLQQLIPAGACVLSDDPTATIAVNRFVSSRRGCAPMVDPVGIDYSLADGRNATSGAAAVPAVRRAWLTAFHRAQYVWLDCGPPAAAICALGTNRRIPWIPAVRSYLAGHFHLVPGSGSFLYARDSELPTSRS
jgi:hypothetical protein